MYMIGLVDRDGQPNFIFEDEEKTEIAEEDKKTVINVPQGTGTKEVPDEDDEAEEDEL